MYINEAKKIINKKNLWNKKVKDANKRKKQIINDIKFSKLLSVNNKIFMLTIEKIL